MKKGEQTALFALCREHLRLAVHNIAPQQPPQLVMVFPGRGKLDALRFLARR